MSEADVVVVGGGGAGLAAAIAAAETGAAVTLLEKEPQLGGSTRLAVGSFSAAGTSFQVAKGIADSASAFAADMVASNSGLEDRDNPSLRELLAGEAARTFEWIHLLGVQFFGPTEEPPFRVPRMHNVIPNARAYVAALTREAARLGVCVKTGVRVERLLVAGDGGVRGVYAGGEYIAHRAVVLAAGDYSASQELKAQYMSEAAALVPPVNPGSTGEGFVMGMALGAGVRNMDLALEELRLLPPRGLDPVRRLPATGPASRLVGWCAQRLPRRAFAVVARRAMVAYVAPSLGLLTEGAILVGPGGQRFCNELEGAAQALARQPANRCYMIFDARVADTFARWPRPVSTFPGIAYAYVGDYLRLRPDVAHRARTVSELARAVGVEPAVLDQTVCEYNGAVSTGRDEAFGREPTGLGVCEPPFYGFGPLGAFTVLTDGGLLVNERCQVLSEAGRVIPRLYAAGSNGQGGLLLRNHGLHIAWALTSGRIAGRLAAGTIAS